MSPSLHRFKGMASEPISQRKSSVEQPLLQELLPAAALHLASPLSDEEKEILVFLVLFGRNVLLSSEASNAAVRSPWKPWKSFSSKAGMRQQVCTSCPFSGALAASMTLTEEGLSKGSPLPHAKYKRGFSCDCFSCYSSFWSRWNASTNRDIINDILEVIESIPHGISTGSKGKKKKKLEKKRERAEVKVEKDEFGHIEMALTSSTSGLKDEGSHALGSMDTSCSSLADDGSHTSVSKETGPSTIGEKITAGRKKSLFRVVKQKENPFITPPNMALTAGSDQNAISVVVSMLGESESRAGAVAIEVPENPENLTLEPLSSGASGLSFAASRGKNNPKLHRLGKRRSNQILPLDCEDVPAVERDQTAVIEMQNTDMPMSPRVADAGLGGRGFLARVFPDALGRVASRLWDLVSVRLRSRTVEYH